MSQEADTIEKLNNLKNVASSIAFHAPSETYIPRVHGRWMVEMPLSFKGLVTFLAAAMDFDPEDIKYVVKERIFATVIGTAIHPNNKPLVSLDGHMYVNVYVPPTMKPTPGPYPRIDALLDWLTDNDTAGKAWLVNWIAAKVQKPLFLPKVAVVFNGKPGAGKGTLAAVMAQMLGPENCATITERNLLNRFNSRWTGKLFVLADEVLTRENTASTSELLKVLIDAGRIELEKKGRDQVEARNHIAWMFASNDTIAPVQVEIGDRRYSVFSNHNIPTPEHKALLAGAFRRDGDDSSEPTDSFAAEIAGFMHACLAMDVDYGQARTVYENESRAVLLASNRQSAEAFFEDVETREGALDALLTLVGDNDVSVRSKDRASWDFGDAVATDVFYRCYLAHCADSGVKYPQTKQKFGASVKARGYEIYRPLDPVTKRQAYAYRGPWLRVESEPKAAVSNVVNMKGR